MNGREVLQEVKADSELKRIPVVVLTSSEDEADIFQSYNLHANSYITKPVDIAGLIKAVEVIDSFWLTIVKLPTE